MTLASEYDEFDIWIMDFLFSRVLMNKVKAPYVGPPKSKIFPNGVEVNKCCFNISLIRIAFCQFGMYSNSCGQPNWIATGLIHRESICCKDGKYDKC